MRFVIDNALSPVVAEILRAAGYDAVHVRSLGMHAAPDDDIFAWAAQDGRVVITADLDFGTLLALGHGTEPSIVLLRRVAKQSPEQQVTLILANLPRLAPALDEGCIAVLEPGRVRIRSLPIGGG